MAPAEQGEEHWQRAVLTCLALTFLNPHFYLDTMVLLGSLSTHYPGARRWAFAWGACLVSVTWFTSRATAHACCSRSFGTRVRGVSWMD